MSKFEIIDLVIGTGKMCERGALITAHYTGTLTTAVSLTHRTAVDKPLRLSSVQGV